MMATGLNANMQLGVNNKNRVVSDNFEPVTIFNEDASIAKIFCADKFSGLITDDSEIFVWGEAGYEEDGVPVSGLVQLSIPDEVFNNQGGISDVQCG